MEYIKVSLKLSMQQTDTMSTKPSSYPQKPDHGNWFRVPNTLIDNYGRELGPSGVAVYCVLARYANGETRKAFPSHSQIAGKLGISRRTVIRKIKQLQEVGLIKHKKRGFRYCIYLLK